MVAFRVVQLSMGGSVMQFKSSKSLRQLSKTLVPMLALSATFLFVAGCADDPPPIEIEFMAEDGEATDGEAEIVLNEDGTDPNALNADGTVMSRDEQIQALLLSLIHI